MRTRLLIATTVLSAAAGCYRVKPVWQPEAFLAQTKPEVVYLRMRDIPPITVANPRLIGDTLLGTRLEGGEVAVKWTDVVDVYASQIDGTATAFSVASVTILSGLVVYALLQGADGSVQQNLCVIPPGSYDHDLDPECSR